MEVGFIGLGAIGHPIAKRLAEQHRLTVWNRTVERAQAFADETGATVAASPKEVGTGAEVVLTCLPNSPEVEAVLAGTNGDGLAEGLEPGALVIDLTSGIPSSSKRIAEDLAAKQVAYLDAPVSGGTSGAAAGTLTVMVGGSDEAFARALPILQVFGKRIEHVGPVGAGHALKAVHNSLIALHLFGLGEALTTLAKAGVTPRKALDVINASNGRSFVSERLIPERVLTREWPRTFRLALLDKDVGIARDLMADVGVEAPVLGLVSKLLHEAALTLGDEADHVEVLRIHERRAGVELSG